MKTNKVKRVYTTSERTALLWRCQARDDKGGEKDILRTFDLPPPKFSGRSG